MVSLSVVPSRQLTISADCVALVCSRVAIHSGEAFAVGRGCRYGRSMFTSREPGLARLAAKSSWAEDPFIGLV